MSTVTTATEPIIEARALEKFYPQPDGSRIQVISPTDIAIYPGQIIALLGPSGCGKSTMLRMLTGLSPTSGGTVFWHGQPVGAEAPNVSIVFQSFALFPWLTVIENVEAPLEARGIQEVERRKRALRIIDAVGLDGFESAYPKELSGGMKQRVGVARALVVEPEVLFMDEPFSALDVLTAETLRGELLELWLGKQIPTRAIFIVTHNIEEAVLLADRIIVLGRNPAHIHAHFTVDLPYPRDRKEPRFVELVDLIYRGGLAYMRYSISDTAEWGDYVSGPRVINEESRKAMKAILKEIQDGSFAKRFLADQNSGRREFLAFRDAEAKHPIEIVGKQLRASMPFLDPVTVEEVAKTR